MLHNMSKSLAKTLMEMYPNIPEKNDLSLNEIFRQDEYIQASEEEQNRIKLSSAQFRYDYEKRRGFFDVYFPNIYRSNEFHKKSILDLGSFTGGRLVQWVERYNFSEARGIDINPIFAEAGNMFAKEKGVNATFDTGFAESLPYELNSFDFIVSCDVFEHVQNVKQAIQECFRVLKPGGKLFAVFPPLETHLGLVTKMPALQWFFSGKTITNAYNEILLKRGQEAYWYSRTNGELSEWERLPTLNGITVRGFRKIIVQQKRWNIVYWGNRPIFSHGRRAEMVVFRVLQNLFSLPARLPLLVELLLSRICCCLEKKNVY